MPWRVALLAWTRKNNAWIVADNYDSELRYPGHPFPLLQGQNPSQVVYLGTLSKVLFPLLQLDNAIVPEPLQALACSWTDIPPPPICMF